MKLLAPAKINLNLSITGRLDNGYHTLDSVMVFTQWGDEMIIKPAKQFTLTADGPYSNIFTGALLSTNRGAPNLIVKAVYMMADKANCNPDIHVHVTKNIPAGAGLGGGSSNAATIMRALNDYWDIGLSIDELCAMGLTLGAELPVCLRGIPSRVMGIGDVIEPIAIESKIMLITWPDLPLMTKDVFDLYRQSPENGRKNDLMVSAVSLCPEIGKLIAQLQSSEGCEGASMSGSGSACFGVFGSVDQANDAVPKFKNAVVTMTTIGN